MLSWERGTGGLGQKTSTVLDVECEQSWHGCRSNWERVCLPAPATWPCPAPAVLWPPLAMYSACGAEAAPHHVMLPKCLLLGKESSRKQEPAGSFVALFPSRCCQQCHSNPLISAGGGARHWRGTGLCSSLVAVFTVWGRAGS